MRVLIWRGEWKGKNNMVSEREREREREIFLRELKIQELGGTLSIFVWGIKKHAFKRIKCRGWIKVL